MKLKISSTYKALFYVLIVSAWGYYLQDTYNSKLISTTLLIIILGVSTLFSIYFLLRWQVNKPLLNCILAFLIYVTCSFLWSYVFNGYREVGVYQAVLLNWLIFFPFYFIFEKRVLERRDLYISVILIFTIALSKFFISDERMLGTFSNNAIYYSVAASPLIFLFRNKSVQLILILAFIILCLSLAVKE